MKTNIKMRVTPEQSKQVQRICFENEIEWPSNGKKNCNIDSPFIFIDTALTKEDKGKDKIFNDSFYIEVDADLFIRTNGTCEETKENNKMEWKEYNGQELEKGKDYLVCTQEEEVNIVIFTKPSNWKFIGVTAYIELPKPYEKPKSLKERLDEAVKKFCYSFSDEEWKDSSLFKWYIAFDWVDNVFIMANNCSLCKFSRYNFKTQENARFFIDSFTTDELMQIMKGEVK